MSDNEENKNETILSLEKFSPMVAEVKGLAEQYAGLSISGPQDKAGYKQVDKARKHLKSTRTEIEKAGKAMRKPALDFQKTVIAREKELISIIEPIEKSLLAMQSKADELIEMEKREFSLPSRLKDLEEFGLKDAPTLRAQLLNMDEFQYASFYNQVKADHLKAKEKELADRERALKEAENKAKKEVEPEPQKADATLPPAPEAKIAEPKTYKEFLMEHGVTTENMERDFYVLNDGQKVSLYRKIGEYLI